MAGAAPPFRFRPFSFIRWGPQLIGINHPAYGYVRLLRGDFA